MPKFTDSSNFSKIQNNPNWTESSKFRSKGRLVDANGRAVSVGYSGEAVEYPGEAYRITKKIERRYHAIERIARLLLGLFLTVSTIGIALASKNVRKLFTKNNLAVRCGILESSWKKPLEVDLNTLGLNLAKKAWYQSDIKDPEKQYENSSEESEGVPIVKEITMREFAMIVINEINKELQEQSIKATKEETRYFSLSLYGDDLRKYMDLGIPTFSNRFSGAELQNMRWWIVVINALVEKKYLHSYEMFGPNFILIQA